MIENLIAKWFYRPADFKMERWRFWKWTHFVAFVVAVGIYAVLRMYGVTQDARFTFVCVAVLFTLAIVEYMLRNDEDRRRRYERWWRGEVSLWRIVLMW